MIPDFTDEGLLPEGIHSATLDEFHKRFAIFKKSDRRVQTCRKIEVLVKDAAGAHRLASRNGLFAFLSANARSTSNGNRGDPSMMSAKDVTRLKVTMEQLGLMLHAYEDLRENVLPKDPKAFALLAESCLEEIGRLRVEVLEFADKLEVPAEATVA